MERTKKKEVNLPRWKNIGGGTFRLHIPGCRERKIIKPNQTFLADYSEIPENLRDVIQCLDGNPEEKDTEEAKKAKSPTFSIESKGGGWYNVVNSEGKVMNESSLHKEEAEKLKSELEGGNETVEE
jgi:hypothetical protein